MSPLTRREFLATSLAAAPALALARSPLPFADDPGQRLAALEARHGGRLGVSIVDPHSGAHLAFRAHDRFPVGGPTARLDAGHRGDAGATTTPAAITLRLQSPNGDDAQAHVGRLHRGSWMIATTGGDDASRLIAACYAESTATPAQRDAVLAEVRAIAAAWRPA